MTPDEFHRAVLDWYDRHGRKDLPWQQDITPYRVWVSEIMLQQTQVSTVVGYFDRFMTRFPNVHSLAAAPIDDVLHLWTGLGYYARARNLHRAAQTVVNEHDGEFPRDLQLLEALPGVGRSTAGAIASISMDLRAPILDGNVKRVLARFFAIAGYPGETVTGKKLWELAEHYTPHQRLRDYTQVMMDLGATLCTRRNPRCNDCPLATHCRAGRTGTQDEFPGRKPRKQLPVRETCMVLLENECGKIVLEQRPAEGIWGGLWAPPQIDAPAALDALLERLSLAAGTPDALPAFRHTFSHFHLQITPLRVPVHSGECRDTDALRWISPASPGTIGLPQPVKRLLADIADTPPLFKEPT